MRISVAWSPKPRAVELVELEVPAGCTLAQALVLLQRQWQEETVQAMGDLDQAHWSIWGRRVSLEQTLYQGDRLEWTRPLRVDPKVARRERFAQQGARSAGLFAKKTKNQAPATEE